MTRWQVDGLVAELDTATRIQGMIPKSVKRFSEKIMPKQEKKRRADSTKLNQTLAAADIRFDRGPVNWT